MNAPIITHAFVQAFWSCSWLTVRELTADDVEWTPWRLPKAAGPDDHVSRYHIAAHTAMLAKPGVLDLSQYPKEVVRRFTEVFVKNDSVRFGDPAALAAVNYSPDISFVGCRKEKQYLKYNEVVEATLKHIEVHGEAMRAAALKKFNEDVAKWVATQREAYVGEFVRAYSKLSSYKVGEIDKAVGTEGLIAEIKELEALIDAKEKELNARRHEVIVKDWQENSEDYPVEAQEALRQHFKKHPVSNSTVRCNFPVLE